MKSRKEIEINVLQTHYDSVQQDNRQKNEQLQQENEQLKSRLQSIKEELAKKEQLSKHLHGDRTRIMNDITKLKN